MKEELKTKEVLAMYDVRGIQNYIFSTNRIRDIIGASKLVENIITEGISKAIKANGWDNAGYLTDWEHDEPDAFITDETVKMQVLFIGGGNAYVLFREGAVCEKVNRFLTKYVLEKTYSLNLAVSVVEKTDSYRADYAAINKKMIEIKAVMPKTKPMGAFPFMAIDTATGYPLAQYDISAKEYISTEAYLKRQRLNDAKENEKEDAERILDNMVTEKGDNSTLAVVHIDGNSVGGRIKEIMQDKENYGDAVRAMRKISLCLKNEFENCFEVMCNCVDAISKKVKPDSKGKLYRKIIVAGDDITFICNAKVAIYAAKVFLEQVTTKLMYENPKLSKEENQKHYAMSACAGIAFFNSHFPFSDAYEVAEACCANAKKVAKLTENRDAGKADGMTGCYLDYQICNHVKATDLAAYRQKQYQMPGGKMMIHRPYYVSSLKDGNKKIYFDGIFDLDERNQTKDLASVLLENLKVFQCADAGNGKYKKLRNVYSFGMQEVENEETFLSSRHIALPKTAQETWYDALEIMEICEWEEEKNNVTEN